jgi:hypothetical protein
MEVTRLMHPEGFEQEITLCDQLFPKSWQPGLCLRIGIIGPGRADVVVFKRAKAHEVDSLRAEVKEYISRLKKRGYSIVMD